MKTIALVGASGTGKSYRAMTLAYEKKVDYIIDDGLLITGNKIVAGKSAKRQKTAVTAVKTALFTHEEHRESVKTFIKEQNPQGILVLGTSKKMVDKIAAQLEIDPIEEYVYIEDISTPEERIMAKKQRTELGKHVIPVPTFEIKKDFSGYFVDPLKIFRKKKDDTVQITEKSVVRPTFSYMGKYKISDKVISDLIHYAGRKTPGIHKISRVDIRNYKEGIAIDVDVIIMYGAAIRPLVRTVQKQIKEEVERMTSLNILTIDVNVKNLILR
ncbi:Asp23/Gls24 family envelope stress response protein [Clostridiaceae bacterium 35-E11]